MKKANSTIFRAYDIRGVYIEDISSEIFLELGKAFGTYVKRKGKSIVTVGGDIRASTQALLFSFTAGVMSTGVSCDLVEKSPLGITLFNSFEKDFVASAFITASHLPPNWNGVKYYWGPGIGFSPQDNADVQKIYELSDFDEVDVFDIGRTSVVNPYSNYVNYLKSKFKFTKKFKIAVDCGNGATALIIPKLYQDLGFEVNSLFDDPDPRFPNRSSEPTEESLSQFSDYIKNIDIDFGAGFDGDGDRCVFTDETGRVISADTFGIIVSDYLLKTGSNNRIVINMECSLAMETYLESIGAEVSRIRVGHSFLSLEGKQKDAVFGVEASGHAIVPSVFLFDDAMILPLIFAEALEFKQKSVSELAKEVKLPIKKRFDFKCSDASKFLVLEQIKPILIAEDGKIDDVDGISLTNQDGRILVRVSNTSPKLRITIESMKQEGFDIIKSKFVEKIKQIIEENS
ncbi:MAG: putative phosphoglucosamine mutase [Candidatus Heimdallarchaeota archaeon LC_2]|nr:MAG: putative phosphoglucosamine mutase [Candidatus Heimdallarchaeota archaeon LC_2]